MFLVAYDDPFHPSLEQLFLESFIQQNKPILTLPVLANVIFLLGIGLQIQTIH